MFVIACSVLISSSVFSVRRVGVTLNITQAGMVQGECGGAICATTAIDRGHSGSENRIWSQDCCYDVISFKEMTLAAPPIGVHVK